MDHDLKNIFCLYTTSESHSGYQVAGIIKMEHGIRDERMQCRIDMHHV